MKLTKSLLIAFTFLSLSIVAQTEIEWGKITPKMGSLDNLELLGKYKSSFVYLHKITTSTNPNQRTNFVSIDDIILVPYITIYDKDLNFVGSIEIKLQKSDTKYNYRFEDVIMIDDKLILFTSIFEKEDKKRYGYMQVLDFEGTAESNMIEMGEIMQINSKRSNFFTLTVSQNKKSFLVHLDRNYINYQNTKVNFRLFDKKANLLWDKEVELPYPGKNIYMHNYVIDENNNLLFFGKVFDFVEKDKKSADKSSHIGEYMIFKLDNLGKKLSTISIPMGVGQKPTNTSLSVKNNTAHFFGFYSDGEMPDAKGVFNFNINLSDGKIALSDISAFSNELNFIFETMKKENNRNDYIKFKVRDINYNSDGGYTFISEYYDNYITTNTDSKGFTQAVENYLYHDILITNVNANGKINWITRIPKKQHIKNPYDNKISYNYISVGKNLYIVYNDNAKNLPLYDSNPNIDISKLKNIGLFGSALILVKVTSQGDFTREPLFNLKDKRSCELVQNSILRGEELLFFSWDKKSNFNLARLKVN
jgi:hypothetical protein